MKHAHIGIDPGVSGGISIVFSGQPVSAWKMPETERDVYDLLWALKNWHDHSSIALIEKVAASPQMGTVSAFTFGRGYGSLRMALIACQIPFEEVTPQKWQKALGCLTGGDKNVSKARAQQLFPGVKWTHATADSALIAEYSRRQHEKP
jgi:crossover junction endodeoxyribonuclease RuvC